MLTCLDIITSYIRDGSYVNVSPDDRSILHGTLLDWIRGKDANVILQIPNYLKTKYCVLVALLIKMDYPQLWPDVFDVFLVFLRSFIPRRCFRSEQFLLLIHIV